MLEIAGVDRVITMDLHADQIQGFFDIPVDNIYATPVLLGDLRKQNYENLLVVSPDVGGVIRARALAKQLNTDLAIIDKRRPKANVAEVMNIIGEVGRPHVRDHGRHGRYRRHPLQGSTSFEGTRREASVRLRHAPGFIGWSGRADHGVRT